MVDINKIKSQKSVQELLEFGILNIDKPAGPTSFTVDEIIKKRLNLRKTSHGGTLDPGVTGVLPVFLNRACKLLGFFLGEDKEYVGVMRVHEEIEMKKVEEVIKKKFLGRIKQTPPVKSRVKRQEREREVKSFELLEQDGKDILFKVECEGGTYIRKLIDDLGKFIGGAHMLELRRTRAGIFNEEKSFTLYNFEKAVKDYKNGEEETLKSMIIPGEIIGGIIPVVEIKEDNLKQIFTGKPIHKKDLVKECKEKNLISVFAGEKFVGIYKVANENEIFAKPEFVMQTLKRKI